MPETIAKEDNAWSEWAQVEPWAVAAVVLPFFISFAAIGAAVIAFLNFRQHPERKGRPLAWLGVALSLVHVAGLVYVLSTFM